MASYLFELSYTFISILLVYFFLSRSLRHRATWTWKHHTRNWILFGFLFNLYGLSWLYTVYPLPWITQNPILQLTGIALLHLILSTATALPYGIVALTFIKKNIHTQMIPLVFALTLTLAEIARSLSISTLYYGKGTTIALHFTAGTLGNALSTTPFIEFAYLGGTFSLTFVLGYLVYCGISKKHLRDYWKHVGVICLLLIGIHYIVPVSTLPQGTTVGIVTTNFKNIESSKESEYKKIFAQNAQKVHTLTRSLASSSPQIIVYPEDTRYLSSVTSENRKEINSLFKKTLFVDGDLWSSQNGFYNVSLFYTPENQSASGRGKELLLPFNEYLPYSFEKIFKLFVDKEEVDTYVRNHTYTPIHSIKTIKHKDMRIGTLICSEILSFSVIDALRKEKPDVVFFQSHLQVFHENPWFDMHLRSFTKVASAQMRTTLISSTSGASSYIVSPYGKILLTIPAGFGATMYEEGGR